MELGFPLWESEKCLGAVSHHKLLKHLCLPTVEASKSICITSGCWWSNCIGLHRLSLLFRNPHQLKWIWAQVWRLLCSTSTPLTANGEIREMLFRESNRLRDNDDYLRHSYLSLSRYISFFVYLKSFILIILSFSLYWEGLVLPGSLLWCKYIAGQWSLISFGPIHLLPSELYLVIYPVLSLTVLEASGLCVVFLRNVPKIYKRIHLIILKSCPCFTTVMDQTVAT